MLVTSIAPSLVTFYNAINFKEIFYLIILKFDHIALSQVTWTLSFEVYFYVLFSVFILSKKAIPFLAIIVTFCLLNLFGVKTGIHILDHYLFRNICLEFILGVLAAVVIIKNIVSQEYGKHLLFAGVAMFLISATLDIFITYLPVRSYRTLFYGVPSSVLIVGLVLSEVKYNVDRRGLLVLLGNASYTTYLIHSPIASASSLLIFKYYEDGN